MTIREAKTKLSKLIADVLAGEEVVIAKDGQPVARLVPWHDRTKPIKGGFAKGKIVIHGEVTDPMPEDWLAEMEDAGKI